MSSENRTDSTEASHMGKVDVHPDVHRATESDEDQVLRGLYGDADDEGFFRGEAPG